MKILMLAAENGALPQGKVGGMGDVIRDLPRALAALGHDVTVLTPAYGMWSTLPGSTPVQSLSVPFGGKTEDVECFAIDSGQEGLSYVVVEHALFSPCGIGRVYIDDGNAAPFHEDASKFAFFSATGAAFALETIPDVVHLHDWHTGLYLALRALDARFEQLKSVRTVFTIHNLALQGQRPWADNESAWHSWFPW